MFHKPIDEIFPTVPAGLDASLLNEERVPAHVAVIMDGNGRWAKARGKNRLSGHKAGIEAVRELIRCASDVGVRYLTIYSFSSENWRRPQDEVTGLMDLFARTMLAEARGLHKEHVRVMTIGRTEALPPKTRAAFEEAWELTRDNTGMTLVVAVNYGARTEIVDAYNALMVERFSATPGKSHTDLSGITEETAGLTVDGFDASSTEAIEHAKLPRITEEDISRHLYTADIPDPDLLIRTSGEMRVSNFLLWQIAYAEFYVTDTLWPDFDRYEFLRALLSYQVRERRWGGV